MENRRKETSHCIAVVIIEGPVKQRICLLYYAALYEGRILVYASASVRCSEVIKAFLLFPSNKQKDRINLLSTIDTNCNLGRC